MYGSKHKKISFAIEKHIRILSSTSVSMNYMNIKSVKILQHFVQTYFIML